MPAVMTTTEADALFDQLAATDVSDEDLVPMPDGIDPGRMNTVYPGKLPGKLVRIYDTKTGYHSDVLPYMLKNVMKMEYGDKTLRYSRRQTVSPVEGHSYCFLHPEFPDAERVRAAGIVARCSKPSALLSIVHAERHAKTRHTDNWNIYQRAIAEEREQEHRDMQKLQLQVLQMQVAGNKRATFDCDACERFFDSAQGLTLHKNKEHREV